MRANPAEYDLVTPQDLGAALRMLSQNPGEWTPIAGGTELMVQYGAGVLEKRRFLSIWNLPELRRIDVSQDWVTIGAGSTFSDIRNHKEVQQEFGLLAKSATWTGSIANQNRGTIGGNIVNASPAADSAPVLLVYEAELELASDSGSRRVPYSEFHLGYKRVDMRQDELLQAIHLPRCKLDNHQYIRKVGPRLAQAISKVVVAGVGRLKTAKVEQIRIAVAAMGPTPLRCVKTEQILLGKSLDNEAMRKAKIAFREEVSPIDDIRSTGEYRTQVGANLLEEFLVGLGGSES